MNGVENEMSRWQQQRVGVVGWWRKLRTKKSYFSCLLLSFTTHKSFIFFNCRRCFRFSLIDLVYLFSTLKSGLVHSADKQQKSFITHRMIVKSCFSTNFPWCPSKDYYLGVLLRPFSNWKFSLFSFVRWVVDSYQLRIVFLHSLISFQP